MRYNNLFSATPLPVSVSFNGNIHVHAVGKCQQSKTTFLNNKKFSYIYSSIMLLVWGVFISIVNFWRRKWLLFRNIQIPKTWNNYSDSFIILANTVLSPCTHYATPIYFNKDFSPPHTFFKIQFTRRRVLHLRLLMHNACIWQTMRKCVFFNTKLKKQYLKCENV